MPMPFKCVITEEEARHIRRYWLAGLCLCCGGELIPWESPNGTGTVHDPEPVAEGVIACGRCIGNRHFDDEANGFPGFLDMMLKALLPETAG